MASGPLAAAGLFVICDPLCGQQVLAGALAYDLSSCLARQSIAGSLLCASAVLLRCTLLCSGGRTNARIDTVGFDRDYFDWSLYRGENIREPADRSRWGISAIHDSEPRP